MWFPRAKFSGASRTRTGALLSAIPATLLTPEPNPAAGMWGASIALLRETSLKRLEEGPWGANREAVRESEEVLIAGDEQRALAFCER